MVSIPSRLESSCVFQFYYIPLRFSDKGTILGKFIPFDQVTRRALQHALAESSLSLSDSDSDKLMESYDSLDLFPDVGPALEVQPSNPPFLLLPFLHTYKVD